MELWILILTINVFLVTLTVGKVSKQLDELRKDIIG
jgi:hypothetical protein